jgi:AcrR family transcriptional regulator
VVHDWDRAPTAAEARRWQLLTAGRRVILERGLEALTVDDVVGAAGVAKGSFYSYFQSRDAFLDALRLALAEDIGEAARQAAAGPWAGLLGRMMRAARDWLIANEPLRALFGAGYMADPQRASRDPLVAVIAEVLRAGVEAGVLRLPGETGDPDTTAHMVLDVMREASARAAISHPDDAPIATAEEFLERALRFDDRGAAHPPPFAPGKPAR